jgi:hypothetical protein
MITWASAGVADIGFSCVGIAVALDLSRVEADSVCVPQSIKPVRTGR